MCLCVHWAVLMQTVTTDISRRFRKCNCHLRKWGGYPCSTHFRGFGLRGDQRIDWSIVSITLAFIPGACLWQVTQGDKTRCDAGAGVFWKHQRMQLGEPLVRTRRASPCPYTHHFNYRPNKTCRNKKAKITSLIKLHKLWTKADSQCLHPCQGKGAYLAWRKKDWGSWWGCAMATEEGAKQHSLQKNTTLPVEINLVLKSV